MTISAAPQIHTAAPVPQLRWTTDAIVGLFELPFNDLLFRAQEVHRQNHAANAVQLSTLLSIKTGGCSEDCGYCSQSAHHGEAEREALLDVEEVVSAAKAAKDKGATRFCMGAAWRGPKDKDLDRVADHDRRGQGAGHGNLRHAGHAQGRPGREAQGRRPRLLQPQPRYRARVLRPGDQHA
jgi:hypothetical protein